MTQTQDYLALLAALDREDDSALAPLADLLEEQGSPLAVGMHKIAAGKFKPRKGDPGSYLDHCWVWDQQGSERHTDINFGDRSSTPVPYAAFGMLRDVADVYDPETWDDRLGFRVRSTAFLALAEALS